MISLSVYKPLYTARGKIALDLSLEIGKGMLAALYGSSGTGKTTLLRLLAGLTNAEKLHIVVNGETWNDSDHKIFLAAQKRSIGFVFQDFALFPNFTLKENISYALAPGQDRKIVADLIDAFELGSLQHLRPAHLSAGQKQRVALARAIARRPKILLLDEPLSALDDEIRQKLQQHIAAVHRDFGLTTILVSHQVSEISNLADEVFCMEEGRITRHGAPSNIFQREKFNGQFILSGKIEAIEKAGDEFIVTISMVIMQPGSWLHRMKRLL
jgi:molybdate transport system ATP-binding protein